MAKLREGILNRLRHKRLRFLGDRVYGGINVSRRRWESILLRFRVCMGAHSKAKLSLGRGKMLRTKNARQHQAGGVVAGGRNALPPDSS